LSLGDVVFCCVDLITARSFAVIASSRNRVSGRLMPRPKRPWNAHLHWHSATKLWVRPSDSGGPHHSSRSPMTARLLRLLHVALAEW
jgi:hypothetical protein